MTGTSIYLLFVAYIVLQVTASAKRHRQQTFSQILATDWDFRYDKVPPFREFVDIDEDTRGISKTITFSAFGRKWRLDVELNKVLFAKNFEFLYSDNSGYISKRHGPMQNCFYIGKVSAGVNENGLAAVTSCQGTFRAYVTTNINDYMINVPIPVSSYLIDIPKGDYTGTNTTQNQRLRRSASGHREKRSIDIIPKAKASTGRMSFLETALFFDRSFQDRFQTTLGFDTDLGLRMYAMELVNNAQLWYLHHTLGYRIWFVVHKVVFVSTTYPNEDRYMNGACTWHQETFPGTKDVDQAFLFTGTTKTCYGMGGAAFLNSACGKQMDLRCACVHDNNFHPGSLLRTFAHEAAHPLGLPDDYNAPTNKICYTGIMRWGVYEDRDWSTCSVHSLDRFLHIKDNNCLWRKNTPGLPDNTSPNSNIPYNVAWRAPVEQSSTYISEKVWGAWKATDGPLAGPHPEELNPELASCTHTQKETNPWIRVDIGDASRNYIDSIDVYNREDCCDKRLANFEVRVGDNRDIKRNTLCYHHKGAVPGGKFGMVRISCDRALRGRYVSVQIIGHNRILSVCEIGVNQLIQPENMDASSSQCHDESRDCLEYTPKCKTDASIRRICQYTCGVCTQAGTPRIDSTRRGPQYPSTEKPGCKDTWRLCYHYKSNDRCTPRWASSCARTCKAECQESAGAEKEEEEEDRKKPDDNDQTEKKPDDDGGPCADSETACPSWATAGHCSKDYIRDMCKRSCNAC